MHARWRNAGRKPSGRKWVAWDVTRGCGLCSTARSYVAGTAKPALKVDVTTRLSFLLECACLLLWALYWKAVELWYRLAKLGCSNVGRAVLVRVLQCEGLGVGLAPRRSCETGGMCSFQLGDP